MKNYPCWRWSADCPDGRIFETAEDLAAAPGVWVDSPALLVQVVQEPVQESVQEPPADVTVSGVVTDAPARKRTRKHTETTDTAAETDALIAQLEEIAQ